MKHPQLVEFAAAQIAKGVPVDEVIAHLRRQKWDEDIIAEVVAAAAGSAATTAEAATSAVEPSRRRGPSRISLALLACLAVVVAVTGAFVLWHYLHAKAIREKTKFVEFSGDITGQLGAGSATASGAPTPDDFRLLDFKGVVDSALITEPRAALSVAFDPSGETAAALPAVPSATDARYLATTLLATAAASKLFNAADLRWGGDSIFVRPERTPWSNLGGNNLVSGLLGAFLGQELLSNPWLRITTGKPGIPGEQQATWALLFRPAGQVFGTSKELSFLDRADSGDVNGVPTEIHRYAINGPWLTERLRGALREVSADKQMEWVARLQSMLAGSTPGNSSLDTLTIDDGEMKVWVGKSDALPYRIVANLRIREGTSAPIVLDLRGELDARYGQPVKIELPPDSVGIEKVRQQLEALQSLGGMFQR